MGYKEMSYISADQSRFHIWAQMRGYGRGLSQWIQLYTGAQIDFGDLTPYLTYDVDQRNTTVGVLYLVVCMYSVSFIIYPVSFTLYLVYGAQYLVFCTLRSWTCIMYGIMWFLSLWSLYLACMLYPVSCSMYPACSPCPVHLFLPFFDISVLLCCAT